MMRPENLIRMLAIFSGNEVQTTAPALARAPYRKPSLDLLKDYNEVSEEAVMPSAVMLKQLAVPDIEELLFIV